MAIFVKLWLTSAGVCNINRYRTVGTIAGSTTSGNVYNGPARYGVEGLIGLSAGGKVNTGMIPIYIQRVRDTPILRHVGAAAQVAPEPNVDEPAQLVLAICGLIDTTWSRARAASSQEKQRHHG